MSRINITRYKLLSHIVVSLLIMNILFIGLDITILLITHGKKNLTSILSSISSFTGIVEIAVLATQRILL
ncbi:hypothetical protein BD770DRAFT_403412 [Pilaira anomala]|nr:hypothetical protein BD770DRAFT_403412 [Pilaira anomala]